MNWNTYPETKPLPNDIYNPSEDYCTFSDMYVISDGEEIRIGYLVEYPKNTTQNHWETQGEGMRWEEVRYWMPLPKLPA